MTAAAVAVAALLLQLSAAAVVAVQELQSLHSFIAQMRATRECHSYTHSLDAAQI